MRNITMTLAAAILVVGSMSLANAQTQGASSLHSQAQNALREFVPKRPPPGGLFLFRHWAAYSSSTTAPSRMVTRRSICAAMSRLWVAMTAASPVARTNCRSAPKT
jgi:hypothetical protein